MPSLDYPSGDGYIDLVPYAIESVSTSLDILLDSPTGKIASTLSLIPDTRGKGWKHGILADHLHCSVYRFIGWIGQAAVDYAKSDWIVEILLVDRGDRYI